uniref:Uncharacterized protein n=1 Tax=Acrobeloides nanus TaxID=290746 RepID=A0A914C7V5_9BILA
MCEFLHIFNVNDGSRTQVKTYVVIDHENGFSILYENMLNMVEMVQSLKYCIFKEVKIDENYGLQKIQPIKVLQKITKICHQKIKTINYYCERQTEHFLRILETYVSAQKLIFNSYYAESIVQEPKNFIIPMSQKEILMELDVMPRTNNLLKYISRGEFFGGDRVTIHIFWDKVDEEFNEKILEVIFVYSICRNRAGYWIVSNRLPAPPL